MRVTVDIDERLLALAMKAGGYRTKRSAIEAGLNLLAQLRAQQDLRKLRGKVEWIGDRE